jgi:hypothetical protein
LAGGMPSEAQATVEAKYMLKGTWLVGW